MRTIFADNPEYSSMTTGMNRRLRSHPVRVEIAETNFDVLNVVQSSFDTGDHLAVKSSGHCADSLVDNAQVSRLLDLRLMNSIAICDDGRVSAGVGATIGDFGKFLYTATGGCLPLGSVDTVALGGFVSGGGYGPLSRLHGLIVDHLTGVEMVVIDRDGQAKFVQAGLDSSDDDSDLILWACTGGGGGSFGAITRYVFGNCAEQTAAAPAGRGHARLPQSPYGVQEFTEVWMLSGIADNSIATLITNFSRWCEENVAQGLDVATSLTMMTEATGILQLKTHIFVNDLNSATSYSSVRSEMLSGVTEPDSSSSDEYSWYDYLYLKREQDTVSGRRSKIKSAYFKTAPSGWQVASIIDSMRGADIKEPGSGVILACYGGQVNSASCDQTAVFQRKSCIKLLIFSTWNDKTRDSAHVGWTRRLYANLFDAYGGLPSISAQHEGAYINYPDVDLRDPAMRYKKDDWSCLYFGSNYARLQVAKALLDPLNVFNHRLSIEPPLSSDA